MRPSTQLSLGAGWFWAEAIGGRDFSISGFGSHEYHPKGMLNRPVGNSMHLLVVFHSPVTIELGDGWHAIESGDAILFEPWQRHHFGDGERSWSHSWLWGEGPAFDHWCLSLDLRVNEIVRLPDPEMASRYFEAMREEVASHHPPDSEIVRNLLDSMMRELGRQMRSRGPRRSTPAEVQRAQRLLEEQWDSHVTLGDLASEVCLSPAHLCAQFSRHIGQPPIDYQAGIRVRRAALLLRNFELTVSDVARQVGYDEPGYFSKVFRRRMGVSPSDYRANLLAATGFDTSPVDRGGGTHIPKQQNPALESGVLNPENWSR